MILDLISKIYTHDLWIFLQNERVLIFPSKVDIHIVVYTHTYIYMYIYYGTFIYLRRDLTQVDTLSY